MPPFFLNDFSAHADGEHRGARSNREGGVGKVSAGRAFGCLEIGAGPRRSPSACPENLKKKDSPGPSRCRPRGSAAPPSAFTVGTLREPTRKKIAAHAYPRARDMPAHASTRMCILFFQNLGACRRRTPKDPCRSEGAQRRVSPETPRPLRRRPPVRSSPSALAVGMLRDFGRKKRMRVSAHDSTRMCICAGAFLTRKKTKSSDCVAARAAAARHFGLYIGSISASPTACPLCGYGRAGSLNDCLSEAVILFTGTSIPAQWTCRRRCRYRADIEPRV